MNLSAKEEIKVKRMLKEARRPGMVIWMELGADGDTHSKGYAQGDPFDLVMMAMHAVDFAANAFGIKPEQMVTKMAELFSGKDYKPSNIGVELRVFK